ncbi:MAG: hypothetical protein LWW75_11140, partial [Chlorobiales bacterium]|nr:hypothetical protein [Chlorobiales bacterium]
KRFILLKVKPNLYRQPERYYTKTFPRNPDTRRMGCGNRFGHLRRRNPVAQQVFWMYGQINHNDKE